jgi:hypothetical protein
MTKMSAPLILAIQPDKRQASQLPSIARRVSAELLLTDSAAKAIVMLGKRVPDLILTPPLLSHKDELALTERLRELGSAGAHIQTLTIPILETAESPAPKRVLSSLRKPKRKGKDRASETVGCTADTFAEQVSVYLSRAVEARPISAPAPEEPATPSVAAPAAPEPELPKQPKQPEISEAEADASVADRLPTIEELSARTPAVPEPVRSVGTRIDAITARAPSPAVVPVPATVLVETRMDAIAALVPKASGRAEDAPVPVPQGTVQVAELSMELPPSPSREAAAPPPAPSVPVHTNMEAVAAVVALVRAAESAPPLPVLAGATPLVAVVPIDLSSVEKTPGRFDAAMLMVPAAPIETGLGAVAAMVPIAKTNTDTPAVPMPAAPPAVAALRIELSSVDNPAGKLDSRMPVLPIETSLDAIAAMVPLDKAPGTSPALVAAIPQVAELPMELPALETAAHLQTTAAFVSAPPAGAVEMSMAAVAAMMPRAGASADSNLPMPAMTPHVGELPMTLPAAETAPVHAVMPAVPESGASVEMNMQAVARMVPTVGAHDHHLPIPLPAVAPRVNELTVQLSSSDMLASVNQKAPGFPANAAEATIDTLAVIAPLARTIKKNGSVPVPALTPYVAELPMPLAAMTAAAPARVIVVPAPPVTVPKTDLDAVAAIVSDVESPEGVLESPGSPTAVMAATRRKTKKKVTLKDRKAARKLERGRTDRLDESSLFDPEECRFSALVAKLDEVGAGTHESGPPAGAVGSQRQRRKRRTAVKHA